MTQIAPTVSQNGAGKMSHGLYDQSDIKRSLCSVAIGVITREPNAVALRSALLALCAVGSACGITWRELCAEVSLGLPGYTTQQVANLAER